MNKYFCVGRRNQAQERPDSKACGYKCTVICVKDIGTYRSEACSSQGIWAGGRVAGEGKEVCLLGVGKRQILTSWALEIMTCHRGINRLKSLCTHLFVYLFSKYLSNIHYIRSSLLGCGNTVVSKTEPLSSWGLCLIGRHISKEGSHV